MLILTIEYKKQWYENRVPTWATLGEAGEDINISNHLFQTTVTETEYVSTWYGLVDARVHIQGCSSWPPPSSS
jgi:hypothetical protein